jgi:hypothetical protein
MGPDWVIHGSSDSDFPLAAEAHCIGRHRKTYTLKILCDMASRSNKVAMTMPIIES